MEPPQQAQVQIGAYRLLHKLGEGGMGAVFLAEHVLLGRKAAIKVLVPEMSANQEIVNRFFNEAKATTSIADLGIVQIFDFGYHTDGSGYIVMELLEGESFDARLRRLGRFAPLAALRLIRQVATSLAAAHARGIVHRDLKPENLFIIGDVAVTGGERPKILDFGIAKLANTEPNARRTHTGAIMGTPVFMSPEQCRGTSNIDHRSDIYAIGCVLFTMLTGRPPFEGEGIGDIMFAHIGLPPPAPSSLVPGLPAELDRVIAWCLAKLPADRPASMRELAAELAAIEELLVAVPAAAATIHASHAARATPLTTLRSANGQSIAPAAAAASSRVRTAAWLGIAAAVIAASAIFIAGQLRDPTSSSSGPDPVGGTGVVGGGAGSSDAGGGVGSASPDRASEPGGRSGSNAGAVHGGAASGDEAGRVGGSGAGEADANSRAGGADAGGRVGGAGGAGGRVDGAGGRADGVDANSRVGGADAGGRVVGGPASAGGGALGGARHAGSAGSAVNRDAGAPARTRRPPARTKPIDAGAGGEGVDRGD